MEVRKGYRQTEVGVIPEDWDVGILEKNYFIIDCKHITADFVENGIPVASIGEVQSRFVDLANAKQTTQSYYLHLIEGGRKPQVGDLIFSRNATVGETAQVADWHPVFAVGQDVCIIRKKNPNFSSDYIQDVIRSGIVINQLSSLMAGSTFKRVNVQQIKNFIVPMPKPAEQHVIAAAISDVDDLLNSLDALIAKKRLIKQGAMQGLLTSKKRLPGFSGEWEVKTLGEYLKFQVGFPFSSTYFNDKGNGLRLVKNRDLKSDDQIIYYSGDYTNNFIVENDDVLIGMDGDFIPALWKKGKALLNQRVGRLVAIMEISLLFLFYYLQEPLKAIENRTSSTTVKHLSHSDIENIKLPLPTIKEQTAIAEILSDMDAEISALQQKREKTRLLKQGMMQELLTGRIRLV